MPTFFFIKNGDKVTKKLKTRKVICFPFFRYFFRRVHHPETPQGHLQHGQSVRGDEWSFNNHESSKIVVEFHGSCSLVLYFLRACSDLDFSRKAVRSLDIL